MRRLGIIGAIVVILATAGVVIFAPPTTASDETLFSESVTIQRRDVNNTIGTNGIIKSDQHINLTFDIGGDVIEVRVKEGDRVTAGQILARLDTTDLTYQLQLKQEALLVAQTNYDKLIAPPTEEAIARAQATLANAQAQLVSVEKNMQNAPSQISQSCASIDTKAQDLTDAQNAYAEYIQNGYEWDATFIPDRDSMLGRALTNAQIAYDNALSACDIATNNADYTASKISAEMSVQQAQLALDSLLAGATEQEIAISQSQIQQAQIQYDQALAHLENATLTAPFDGEVSEINILVGQSVGVSAPAMTLINPDALYLDAEINESDIAAIAIGQSAEIRLEAFDALTIMGIVDYIAPIGTNTQGVITYTVTIALNADSARMTQTPVSGRNLSEAGRAFLPIIQKLGGIQALQTVLQSENAVEELTELIVHADLTDAEQALIDSVGGAEGFVTQFAQMREQASAESTPAPTVPNVVLRVGMSAEADITTQTLSDVLVVPSRAVQFDGNEAYLWMDNGTDTPARLEIDVITTAQGLTVISGDIAEGMAVLVPALNAFATTQQGFGSGFRAPFANVTGGN